MITSNVKRYVLCIHVIMCFGCASSNQYSSLEESEFTEMARDWNLKYVQGSENLDDILAGLDPLIEMWENGKIWTYDELVKFGVHLPQKQVLDIYNDQKLLMKDLGYDYVSLQYISPTSGDTMRETSSRLWKLSDGDWKIMHMNNLIKKEVD